MGWESRFRTQDQVDESQLRTAYTWLGEIVEGRLPRDYQTVRLICASAKPYTTH